jgi:hypothetical protein
MAMLRTQNIKVVRSVLSTMLFSYVEVPIFPRRVLKVYSHHILFRSFSYPNLFGKKALMLLLLEQYLWLFPIGQSLIWELLESGEAVSGSHFLG